VQTCYVDAEHRAIADLVKPGELTPNWTITRINVPEIYRGHGYGSALLDRILADADEEQVTLRLEIFPSGGLDYDQLVAWYERKGFMMTPSGYMKRQPRQPMDYVVIIVPKNETSPYREGKDFVWLDYTDGEIVGGPYSVVIELPDGMEITSVHVEAKEG
jgi:hypothetical protein